MKVICPGYLKTGTTSLANALRILGYKTYDYFEQVEFLGEEFYDLLTKGKVPDFKALFQDVDAITDNPGCLIFEELFECFPDAKVILTVRDEKEWLRSLKNHMLMLQREVHHWRIQGGFEGFHGTPLSDIVQPMLLILSLLNENGTPLCEAHCDSVLVMAAIFGTPLLKILDPPLFIYFYFYNNRGYWINRYCRQALNGSENPDSSFVHRKRYRLHNERVKQVIPKDQLLIYNVKQGWKPLCDFLGHEIPDEPFPHMNPGGGVVRELAWKCVRKTASRLFVWSLFLTLFAAIIVHHYF